MIIITQPKATQDRNRSKHNDIVYSRISFRVTQNNQLELNKLGAHHAGIDDHSMAIIKTIENDLMK